MRPSTFLIEIGCEEIPASMVPGALADLSAGLLEALRAAGLGGDAARPPRFGGPRRLVALIEGIRPRGEDRVDLVTGPPVSAAFGKDGRPTRAAEGFAKAHGVGVDDLERVRGEKGEVVAARQAVSGRHAREVLRETIPGLLGSMRFPKMMKWGNRGHSFVRPVHWIVALLDEEIVEFEFVGVRAGRRSHGHRYLAPGPHEIPDARAYERILAGEGRVVVDNAKRAEGIREALDRAAAARGWTPRPDEDLLAEVMFLNESPAVVAGEFPVAFLDLPEEVLVTAMRHHQKYFTVATEDGSLAPGFLAVIDRDGDPDGIIVRGNEWVLRARLADARFFWSEDRKRALADRTDDLERITFQERLGHVAQRVSRLAGIAEWLADRADLDPQAREDLILAARLCKSDLTTGMVGEFPELQGRIGGIYARADGHSERVARAIGDHYLPTSPEGAEPSTPEGALLALADKIDLLVGCFGVGIVPKGSADPYGLRRAALGICRILRSGLVPSQAIALGGLIDHACGLYAAQGLQEADPKEIASKSLEFLEQRLRHLMETSGVTFDTARAVTAAGFDDICSAWHRAESLSAIRKKDDAEGRADFESLATSAKRIRNILAQARSKGIEPAARVDDRLLVDRDEKALNEALRRAGEEVAARMRRGEWESVWSAIAALRPPVDRFFDHVLVMAEDASLRANRLALLGSLSDLLRGAADFSEIVVEGETAEGAR